MSFPFDLQSAAVYDSHLPCHAPTMPFFSRPSLDGRAVALRRTAWSEHGMASVNQARPHCVNQMGNWTHSGTAWQGNGMLCVNRPSGGVLSLPTISAFRSLIRFQLRHPLQCVQKIIWNISLRSSLFCCYTAYSGYSLPTFRDNLSVRVKQSKKNAGNTLVGKFVA